MSVAHAQSWPARPIRVIVPFPPASGIDSIARPFLAQLAKQLGQPVVVENRPGAGGTIGMAAVAQAEPDGYTFLVHSNSFTVVPATYSKLTFDTARDFVGVLPLAALPMALVVAPSKGYRSLNDLITAAKSKPGSITYASAGAGGSTHLGAERFRAAADFDGLHVPYKGSAEALIDVMTARVDYYFSPIGLALPQIKAGKLAALAVGSSGRSSGLPDVPTTLESGLPNSDYNVWVGLMAHAKTPRPIVQRLHDELVKAIHSAEAQDALKALVAEPMIMSLDQFEALLKREFSMNAALVKAAGVTVN
ncbi:MAG: tripartite tricarboxylate transporter substrate binding protein [Betaproteobacteria bacterium]|nr:tripartite tricarboxylate transporter substrate binding protein [Betaproteobacteria bacterium]